MRQHLLLSTALGIGLLLAGVPAGWAAEPALRDKVLSHLEASRKASRSSGFRAFALSERKGFKDLRRPAVALPRETRGARDMPDNHLILGPYSQSDVLFDKSDRLLKHVIRRKAARLRLETKMPVWDKIDRLQKIIRQQVRHAGNDVSPDTNPNRYTLFNQRARQEDRMVSLGEYLKLGRVVCREMALLTEVALEDAGIRSKVVKGDVRDGTGWSAGHAWNEVLVKGTWYVVDTTNPQFNRTKHNDLVSKGTPNGWLWTESIREPWVVNRGAVSGRLQM